MVWRRPLEKKVPEVTVYFWLVKVLTTAMGEATSDYMVRVINPIIAVSLGWLFFREHIGLQELLAMFIIFAGVALVKRYSRPPSPEPAQASAAS